MRIKKMSWHGMKSTINIRVITTVSMGLVIFTSIFYLYIYDYLREAFIPEKYLGSAISKLKTDAYNEDWIKKMEEKYRRENERIRKICNKHRAAPFFDSNNNDEIQKSIVMDVHTGFVIDVTHRLAYCPNGKVAMYFYIRLV